jgi:hypothetical protein
MSDERDQGNETQTNRLLDEYTSVSRIEIPPSVAIIPAKSFAGDNSLINVVFAFDCCVREIQGFHRCESLCRIEIPASVEIISHTAFYGCSSLNDIQFSTNSHLKDIQGFQDCQSLCRIGIPASVEIISQFAFDGCSSLNDIQFPITSQLREIHGFRQCESLCRIEFPVSVEVINGFNSCLSLQEAIIPRGSRVKAIGGFWKTRLRFLSIPPSVTSMTFRGTTFLVYQDDNQLKHRQRLLHLSRAVSVNDYQRAHPG